MFTDVDPLWAAFAAQHAGGGGGGGASDDLWAAIAYAGSHGVAGRYQVVPLSNVDVTGVQAFVNLELPEPYSIPWLVTLVGWRFSTAAPGALIAAYPSDNQVTTNNPAPGRPVQARVQWGKSIEESAVIDYPWGGLTFTMHGRICRVFIDNLIWTATSIVPELGAFAVPAMGHAGVSSERTGPRSTTALVQIPQGAFADFPIPRRACGYRAWSDVGLNDAIGSSGYAARLEQLYNQAVSVAQVDYDGTFGLAQVNAPSSASRWWPLHPSAEIIRATNTNPVAPGTEQRVGLQFMMDLG